jgi:hypothetical protein
MAVGKVWAALGLTGGTGDDLDGIGVASITNNDFGITQDSGGTYHHKYNSSSTDTENVPYVIKPDDAGASGRWILSSYFGSKNDNQLLNPDFRLNQDVYDFLTSVAAGNYFFDGWFNKSGNASHVVSFDTSVGGGFIPGTDGVSQLFGHRLFISAKQISGIEHGETLTISAELDFGTIEVYTGYGTSSSAALTLVSTGTIDTTTKFLNFTANFGGSESTFLAVELRGTGRVQNVKVERGFVQTEFEEPIYDIEIKKAEFYYKKTYNYSVAPGTVTNVGNIDFRNDSGGAQTTFRNLPSKVDKMFKVPSVTIYSPNSGNSGNIYNITGTADVAVSSVPVVGENGFSTIILGASLSSGDNARYHAVYNARL